MLSQVALAPWEVFKTLEELTRLLYRKVHKLFFEKSPKRLCGTVALIWANGAREEKLLELLLVKLDDKLFDH